MYQFKYALTREDYIDFNIYFTHTSKTMVTTINLSRALILLIGIFLPFVISGGFNWPVLLVTGTFAIIICIFFPKLIDFQLVKKIEKMLEEEQSGDMFEDKTILIGDEGIFVTGKSSTGSYQWSGVTRIGSSTDYVYIFFNRVTALIVPMHQFDGNKAVEDFIKYCNNKMTVKASI